MSHPTSIRRSASIVVASGLVAISMAGPASARPDPGTGSLDQQHCSVSCYWGTAPAGANSGTATPVNGNTGEFVQLGAGLLAGLALAGAGAAAVSRRRHGHLAHPA